VEPREASTPDAIAEAGGRRLSDLASDVDALRPVRVFFPDWSDRRIADNCRARRIPGAIKIGKEWMMRPSDVERWVTGKAPTVVKVPTVEDAMADLRRRGLG
jgi:hypothetical protein